eukprot:scaffold210263_cov48-Attheya_sp.AAC.1
MMYGLGDRNTTEMSVEWRGWCDWGCDWDGGAPDWLIVESHPDPVVGSLISPSVLGPQSLNGIGGLLSAENGGGGVARSPILALYTGGSSIPATDIFESMVAMRFDRMLEVGWCFCMAMVVMERRSAHQQGVGLLLFSLACDCSIGKFCLVHFPPINVSYCILLTHILTTS